MERMFIVLGGIEVVVGGIVTVWPESPEAFGYIAIVIGIATILYGVFKGRSPTTYVP